MGFFKDYGSFLVFGAVMIALSAGLAVAWFRIKSKRVRIFVTLTALVVVLICSYFLISDAFKS